MESRKMVLVNLFPKNQWRHKYKEHTCGLRGGKERVG